MYTLNSVETDITMTGLFVYKFVQMVAFSVENGKHHFTIDVIPSSN